MRLPELRQWIADIARENDLTVDDVLGMALRVLDGWQPRRGSRARS